MKRLVFVILAIILVLILAGFVACGDDGYIDHDGNAKSIQQFSYSHSGMSTGEIYCYTFTRDGNVVAAEVSVNAGNDEYTVEISQELMQQVEELIFQHGVRHWDGFDKTNSHVSDGEGFDLYIKYCDGMTVSAHGSNAFPEGYGEFHGELVKLLSEVKVP